MIKIQNSAVVPYSAQQLYDLVNDVAQYPKFVTGCTGARVQEGASCEQMQATVEISKGPVTLSFTTRNDLKPYESIILNLVEGPFKQFNGQWRFETVEEGGKSECRISFELEFGFKQLAMQMLLGPVLKKVAEHLLDSFVQRAHTLYAKAT